MRSDTCFIIAEAGTCHASLTQETRVDRAVDYVYEAANAGADAVKFQVFQNPSPRTMFCWIEGDEDRCWRWRDSYINLNGWRVVKKHCDQLGIVFLASAFEYETVKWLTELQVSHTKVASRAAGNLEEYKDAPKPLLVSNGMYDVEPSKDVIVVQCEANYPSTAFWTGKHYGFSDHSGNTFRALSAIDLGCKLIEVHFYIKPEDAGPDLAASLTLAELKLLCEARDAV